MRFGADHHHGEPHADHKAHRRREVRYSWSAGDVAVRSRDWGALLSVLLMIAMVFGACAAAGVRL